VLLGLIAVAVFVLAYANGANDNFKGVATLFGSGTTDYRPALLWATGATLLGSLLSVELADGLAQRFSGRGLVPDSITQTPDFAAAVALGAGATVLLATRLGFPISTTHALVGALVGAGWVGSAELSWANLGTRFFVPLLFSPLVGLVAAGAVYPTLRSAGRVLGVSRQSCLCVGVEPVEVICQPSGALVAERARQLSVAIGTTVTCRQRYEGNVLGMAASQALEVVHYLSSGLVSLARGLNDTPKIAAMLLLVPSVGRTASFGLIAVVIAVGGLLSARQVAESMSHRITAMSPGQGFAANLVTGLLVVAASPLGLPVSTTHVSCGALFGIGVVGGQARWEFILKVVTAWVTTLPVACAFGALAFVALHH
jgi:inorganic phosphate transporter, PiT family